ncbi:MAG: sn-glycerol-3-phosphate ABC transporter ATP-binding protein UgpC [Bdellovibrionota bacterium]
MAEVILDNVQKNYGTQTILKSLSLSVQKGEFIALVGPSGCGKSTTLRMIAGLEEITSGTIKISDRVMNDVEPRDRDIAMVFQSYALYPHLNVFDNMAFGLKLRGTPKPAIQERIAAVAKTLDIEHLLDRKPKALSGGQRQRVAMGRAIVRNPKVFLFDEPLSNLDAQLRSRMRIEIKKLMRDLKATTIYVTHDQTEAMTMADRIVVLKNGEVMQIGTPEMLYNKPGSVFVAQFIGSPSMNIITSVVEGGSVMLSAESKIPTSLMKDGKIILGIRPEDFHLGADLPIVVSGTVNVAEFLGHATLIEFQCGDFALQALVNGNHKTLEGKKTTFSVSPDSLHFFNSESQQRIN